MLAFSKDGESAILSEIARSQNPVHHPDFRQLSDTA
jgi:hypothetical protein